MENLLQPVLDSYPKLSIDKQLSPSYVKMYSKNSKEIVMVFVKNKLSTNIVNCSNEKDNKCESEELELTGSPLKLDLSLHTILDDTLINDEPQLWSKEEATHYPIAINKAREIANLYNKSVNTASVEDALPMWILTNPSEDGKPLLLTVQSDDHHFVRGIVTYEGSMNLEEMDMDKLIGNYAVQEKISTDMVSITVDCKYLLSGISYGSHAVDELLNAPHGGLTELHCEWKGKSLQTPYISCNVDFEQEVIVGHLASPCNAIWKSVCSLHNINQLLVDMTAAGYSSVNLETAIIRASKYEIDSIANVEIQRKGTLCKIKCKLWASDDPDKQHHEVILIVETGKEIISVECINCNVPETDCGCLHTVAFPIWVHTRTLMCNPEVCYWQSRKLDNFIDIFIKLMMPEEAPAKQSGSLQSNDAVFKEFLQEIKKQELNDCKISKYIEI